MKNYETTSTIGPVGLRENPVRPDSGTGWVLVTAVSFVNKYYTLYTNDEYDQQMVEWYWQREVVET